MTVVVEEVPPQPPAREAGAKRPRWGLVVASLVIGLIFASPFIYLVWRNVELRADVGETFFSSATLEPLGRTLLLAFAVAASTTVVGTGLAWLTARTDLRGRRFWAVLAPLPLVFPSFVGAMALITAFNTGGLVEQILLPVGIENLPEIEGFTGSWLVLTLFTYPFVYLPVAARLKGLPTSLEESARLLGKGSLRTFVDVVVPQIRRAIGAGALLVFLYTLSDFGVVQLMRYDTLTRVIYENRLFRPGLAFGAALLLGILAVIVVVLERSANRRKEPSGSGEGRPPRRYPLRRWRWPALAAVVFFMLNALIAPVVSLAYWVWRDLQNSSQPLSELASDLGDLGGPALNTAVMGVVAAAVAAVVVLPPAYLTARYRSMSGSVANVLVVGGFALPGIAIALALVFWTNSTPLLQSVYQTIPILVLAYVIHFGAQAMRSAQVAITGVPYELDESGQLLGASRIRRMLSIDLPLMRAGLVAGGGLVMLSVMKELPATLMLAPIGFDTLATKSWKAQELHSFAEMGLASLVLLAVSGFLTWLLVVRRADAF